MTSRTVSQGEEALARRLTQLDIPLSDQFVAQVVSRYHAPATPARTGSRQHRVVAGVALFAALLGGAVAVPPVRVALAATPVVGPAVSRLVAMAGLPGGVTVVRVPLAPVTTAAVSDNGYTVTVVGSYADSVRTLVILRINPASATVDGAELVDANGESVVNNGDGLGGAIPGEDTLSFNPFKTVGKGDTVTLRIRGLHDSNPNAAGPNVRHVSTGTNCGAAPCTVENLVGGTWDIPFQLTSGGAHPLTPPSAGDLGPVHVTFTAVVSTPVFTEVRLHADGPLADQDIVVTDLVSDSGTTFHPVIGTGGGVDPGNPGNPGTYKGVPFDPQHQDLDALWMGVPKGHYRLVVTWQQIMNSPEATNLGSLQRDVTLP